MTHTQRFSLVAFLGGLLVSALGCQTQISGGAGGGGAGGGGAGGGASGCPSGACPPPPVAAPSGRAIPAEGGKIVTLSNYPLTCASGGGLPCGGTDWWNFEFELPDTALVPGTELSIADLDGWSGRTYPGNGPPDMCGFGGGSFTSGKVKVIAADASHLTLQVSGSDLMGLTPDGTYDVPICAAAAPPPPDDGPAIAMRFAETPEFSPVPVESVGGGPTMFDPDTLMIYLSNGAQHCGAPSLAAMDCVTPRYQVTIHLPQNLQAIGTLPLKGLATVSESETGVSLPGQCSGGGGLYEEGTIEIIAIGAQEVTFKLTGTASFAGVAGNADGTYTAPRCF